MMAATSFHAKKLMPSPSGECTMHMQCLHGAHCICWRTLAILSTVPDQMYISTCSVYCLQYWSYKWDWSVCWQSLEKLNMWGVDIFHIAKHSNNRPLTAIVFTLLEVGEHCK